MNDEEKKEAVEEKPQEVKEAEEAKESAEKTENKVEETQEVSEEVKAPAEEVKEEEAAGELPTAAEAQKEEAPKEAAVAGEAPKIEITPKEETKPEEKAPTPPEKEEPKPEVPKKEEPKKDLPAGRQEVKVSGKLAAIIKEIEGLTVPELADLVHALEQKFGVTAAAPMAAAPAGGPAAGSEVAEQETQTTFNVILADSGTNKISVIKAIRELVPTLGLKEAKDLVDTPPKPVLQGAGKDAANEAKQKLEAAGAKVELQ